MRCRSPTRANSARAGWSKLNRKELFSMSHELINRSPDLKRLREGGYFVQIRGGLLLMRDVPYVNSQRQVCTGTLISTLNVAGEVARTPETHVMNFAGE